MRKYRVNEKLGKRIRKARKDKKMSQEEDKFIMSDDYRAYYCYKILGNKEVPCVVLGDPTGENVTFKGKPFLLETPKIKVVKNL